jgi:hypothetical protein
MSWWKTAIYDTCSLITLDKLIQGRPSLTRSLPKKILALEVSFSAEQMLEETSKRMKARTEFFSLPSPTELANLLLTSGLPKTLSDVNKLIYATSVRSEIAVVTRDRGLARAIQQRKLNVGNVGSILRDLVETKKLRSTAAESMLIDLAARKDYLLGIPNPTWDRLKDYTFPD